MHFYFKRNIRYFFIRKNPVNEPFNNGYNHFIYYNFLIFKNVLEINPYILIKKLDDKSFGI